MTAEHLPCRPSWRCSVCCGEWPCGSQRDDLTKEYTSDRLSLAHYLAICLDEAVQDLPRTPPADLYRRFLGWY